METQFEKMDEMIGPESGISSVRSRSPNRMLYEAQVTAIQQQLGALEEVRQKLGLSQRKICQLLMVDPSAWNRWTAAGGSAPPHVWRALQWYFALKKELPGINENYFLSHEMRLRERDAQNHRLKEMFHQMESLNLQVETLKKENQLLSQNFFEAQVNLKKQFRKTTVFGLFSMAIVVIVFWLFFK